MALPLLLRPLSAPENGVWSDVLPLVAVEPVALVGSSIEGTNSIGPKHSSHLHLSDRSFDRQLKTLVLGTVHYSRRHGLRDFDHFFRI